MNKHLPSQDLEIQKSIGHLPSFIRLKSSDFNLKVKTGMTIGGYSEELCSCVYLDSNGPQDRELSILQEEVKKCVIDKATFELNLEKWVVSCFVELYL